MIIQDLQIEDSERAAAVIPSKGAALDGVVSLHDMLRLYAEMFVKTLWDLHYMEAKWLPNNNVIPTPQQVSTAALMLQMECLEHGLTETCKKCVRIMEEFRAGKQVTYAQAVAALKELRERLEDELQGEMFLHLSHQEAQLYENPASGDWKTVIRRFPKTRHDIEESSKCFALGRYAASLFHVMLVAEFGIIEVAKFFSVVGNRPGWGDLERIERIYDKKWADKTPLEQQHSDFLKKLLPLAFAIKDSWRHKISHADNKLDWIDTDFSPEVAREIISATRGFMRTLANDLPK